MKNKEIEEILFDMDLIANHNKVPIYFTQNKVKLLLSYIEQLKQESKNNKETYGDMLYELEKENKQLQNNRDKAIDKLYCWGEALNPDFQKEMLNILKGGSDGNNQK